VNVRMRGLTLEELERRIKVADEILRAINIDIDFDKVNAILENEKLDHWAQANTCYLLLNLREEIKESVIKALLDDHYIDPANVDYNEVGFTSWMYDGCRHHAFVKLSDSRYALIYSCDDKIEYALPMGV
jgi:1,2-phenylacetyl-CoA epoxidase catalytic subunit